MSDDNFALDAGNDEALSLSWVLGVNPSSLCALGSLDPDSNDEESQFRFAYSAGNVGIIYNYKTRSQTLLRGHRHPLRSCVASPDRQFLASADSLASSSQEGNNKGDGGTSVIIWESATGIPLGMIENPHKNGTTALCWTENGQYLITLSLPIAKEHEKDGERTVLQYQEIGVWDCSNLYRMVHEDDSVDPSPVCICDASFYLTPGTEHTSISVSADHPLLGKTGILGERLHRTAQSQVEDHKVLSKQGTIVGGWEILATGDNVISFLCVTKVQVQETSYDYQDKNKKGHGVWFIAHREGLHPSKVEATERSKRAVDGETNTPSFDRRKPHRTFSRSIFVPGNMAPVLTSTDEQATMAETNFQDVLAGATRSDATTRFDPLQKPKPSVTLVATTTQIVAVTGFSDGSILQWANNEALPKLLPGVERDHLNLRTPPSALVIEECCAQVTEKQCLRIIPLSMRFSSDTIARDKPNKKASNNAILYLLLTPCRNYLLVGTQAGYIRMYDLHCRLIAWWEQLEAGPIACIDFVSGAPCSIPNPEQPVTCIPSLLVATHHSLVLSLKPSVFTAIASEGGPEMRGSVLLEGPDAPVTGIAAFTHSHKIAVAVASGCLQVWNTQTKELLVLRELVRSQIHTEQLQQLAAADGLNSVALENLARNIHKPTSLALDPLGRFLAVGTAEGFLFILSTETLADTQTPLPPPHWPSPAAAAASPIERLAFSPDGYHLAASDKDSHVALFRFCRTRERELANPALHAGTTSLGSLGTRTVAGAGSVAAKLSSRRPWEQTQREEEKWITVTRDSWVYIGRVKSHAGPIAGLAFSPLAVASDTASHGQANGATTHAAATGIKAERQGWPKPSFWDANALPPAEDTVGMSDKGGGGGMHGGIDYEEFGGLNEPLSEEPLDQATAIATCVRQHVHAGISLLASIGVDRHITLYNVGGSSIASGVLLAGASRIRVEQLARPTCMTWLYPPTTAIPLPQYPVPFPSLGLAFVNNDSKLRILGVKRGVHCMSTVQGPCYGGVVTHLTPIYDKSKASKIAADTPPPALAYAFATSDRMVGVVVNPITGAPQGMLGVLGHAGPIAALATSHDGSMLYTAGDSGGVTFSASSVCIWKINFDSIRHAAELSTKPNAHCAVFPGLEQGDEYTEICDLFAYAQIHAEAENSMNARSASASLPLREIPSIFRALGYSPSQWDVQNLLNEAALLAYGTWKTQMKAVYGQYLPVHIQPPSPQTLTVDLSTTLRLLVNHRPTHGSGLSRRDVHWAIEVLAKHLGRGVLVDEEEIVPVEDANDLDVAHGHSSSSDSHPSAHGGAPAGGQSSIGLTWADLSHLLLNLGETFTEDEISHCMATLMKTGEYVGKGLLSWNVNRHHRTLSETSVQTFLDRDEDYTIQKESVQGQQGSNVATLPAVAPPAPAPVAPPLLIENEVLVTVTDMVEGLLML